MREIKINNLKNNNKLFYYIKEMFPNVSASAVYKALRNKDIKVNLKRINDKDYILQNGDILQIYIDDTILFGFPEKIDVVYEDENILVVYKPQGILSNNEGKSISEPTFEEYVKSKIDSNLKICHRLDRNTSGLLIFTKNDKAYLEILNGFKNNYISKEYIAYVYNSSFDFKHKIFENYLLKDEKNGFSKIYEKQVTGTQKIITEIFIEKTYKQENYAILRVLIHTGKTHQIRALLSYLSHPIIGDSKYGKNDVNKKFKKYRQMLYAVKYTFNFPDNSYLNYLNNTTIKLDEKKYINKMQ